MQLLIMRHGATESTTRQDAERGLTPLGWQQTVNIARWLQQYLIIPVTALVSPYRRTQQTFAALHSVLPQLTQQPHTLDLTPNGQAEFIVEQLQHDPDLQLPTLLLISHIPLVSKLLSQLCSTAIAPLFTPAMIVAVNLDPLNGRAALQWVQTPATA